MTSQDFNDITVTVTFNPRILCVCVFQVFLLGNIGGMDMGMFWHKVMGVVCFSMNKEMWRIGIWSA